MNKTNKRKGIKMIEKHIYQCEICGEEFAFEDECFAHELKCKTTGLENSVVMMDSTKNVLSLDNYKNAIDRVFFLYIANQEAANQLERLFYDCSYTSPMDDAEETILYPAFFAYQDSQWKSLQDIENEYNELLAIKDEMWDYLFNKNAGK